MGRAFLGVVILTVAVVLAFVGVAEMVTRVSGEAGRLPRGAAGVTPESGETIFWGKGKCSTCHAVGSRGAAIRGPNQGASGPLGLPIAARAVPRAAERTRTTGRPFTPTDYLVECVIDPGAHVVEGFKNEMPDPTRPPISLGPDEIRAVVLYLQTLGGQPDPGAIRLPERVLARIREAGPAAEAWSPYLAGDPRKGEALFFNPGSSAACGTCHAVRGRGGTVGPDLTWVAGTRAPAFIVDAILAPSKEIASGYEPVLVVTQEGRQLTGIVRAEDATTLEIVDSQGAIHRLPKARIQRRVPQAVSLMPGNFGEILTVEEFHDLLAFVLSLR